MTSQEWANAGVDASPVRVGAMLYTLVDPEVGFERAYNRWYERDHQFGGCMVGAGWFSNRRWVATAGLKALRFPADNATVASPATAGSYLAVYWVDQSQLAEALGWSSTQVYDLYGAGRGFEERVHAHTAIYMHQADSYRDADPVPMELALQYPYTGLVSVHVDRADGVKQAQFDEWFAETGRAALLASGSPVASVSSWRPVVPRRDGEGEAPMQLGTGPGTIQRTCQMCFIDRSLGDDPVEGLTAIIDQFKGYAELVDGSGLATVQLVAPFIPTLPGTDTYSDDLGLS